MVLVCYNSRHNIQYALQSLSTWNADKSLIHDFLALRHNIIMLGHYVTVQDRFLLGLDHLTGLGKLAIMFHRTSSTQKVKFPSDQSLYPSKFRHGPFKSNDGRDQDDSRLAVPDVNRFASREPGNTTLTRESWRLLKNRLKELLKGVQHETITTHLHVELFLLKHFRENNLKHFQNYKYIGCSKPACFLCFEYLKWMQKTVDQDIVLPETSHNLYPKWKMPTNEVGDLDAMKELTELLNERIVRITKDKLNCSYCFLEKAYGDRADSWKYSSNGGSIKLSNDQLKCTHTMGSK